MFDEKSVVGLEWECARGSVRRVIDVIPFRGEWRVVVVTDNASTGELIPLAELEAEIARDTANRDFHYRQEQQRASEEKALAEEASLDGFEDTLTPRMRAKAVQALTERGVNSDGVYYRSLRDLIRSRVTDGWRVMGFGPARRLESQEGAFLIQKDITKLGMDYAEFLSQEVDPGADY